MARQPKVKRYGNIYGGRKGSPGGGFFKILCTILIFVLIVAITFFVISNLLGDPGEARSSSSEPTSIASSSEPPASDWNPSSTVSEPPKKEEAQITATSLPQAMITNPAQIQAFVDRAKAEGYNAIVVPMKDQKGSLLYTSTLEKSTQWKAVSPKAVDATSITTTITDAGLTPIASIYAFKDDIVSSAQNENGFSLRNSPKTTWLDNAKESGGKSWLNPYKPLAREYICEVANELITLGFKRVLVDGIQFPEVNLKQAALDDNGVAQADILTQFIDELTAAGNVIVAYNWGATTGLEPLLYAGDPSTYGSDIIAPIINMKQYPKGIADETGTVLTSVNDVTTYILTLVKSSTGSDTTIIPVIAPGQKNDEIITALQALGIESYILQG